jgi:hypothetical protein
MTTPTRIAQLASIIYTQTGIVDQYFQSQGIASPTFEVGYVETNQLPKAIIDSKNAIFEATEELNSLIAGPIGFLTSLNVSMLQSEDSAANTSAIIQSTVLPVLHAIYRFSIASSFPVDSEASFADIAGVVGVPERDIERIIRLAKTHRIFEEPRKGVVTHMLSLKPLLQLLSCVRGWALSRMRFGLPAPVSWTPYKNGRIPRNRTKLDTTSPLTKATHISMA